MNVFVQMTHSKFLILYETFVHRICPENLKSTHGEVAVQLVHYVPPGVVVVADPIDPLLENVGHCPALSTGGREISCKSRYATI